MLGLLLKKQLTEVFRSYFYDAKKNKMRSKPAIALWIVFFVVIMVGVLGGMFTVLSLSLCGSLVMADMGWLYFVLMGGIAILLGAFGSVFNTYAGLYLAKDNDLLLSLPIPVGTIMAARLLNVFLLSCSSPPITFSTSRPTISSAICCSMRASTGRRSRARPTGSISSAASARATGRPPRSMPPPRRRSPRWSGS